LERPVVPPKPADIVSYSSPNIAEEIVKIAADKGLSSYDIGDVWNANKPANIESVAHDYYSLPRFAQKQIVTAAKKLNDGAISIAEKDIKISRNDKRYR
jgi:hypothetical protein